MPRPPGQRNVTSERRVAIVLHLTKQLVGERLPKGSFLAAGVVFGLGSRTISKVWASHNNPAALLAPPPEISRPTKLPAEKVAQRIASVPLAVRKSLRAVAAATCIPKSTLARYLRAGFFRRAYSRIKPKLSNDHKKKRLEFALGHVHRPIGKFSLCIECQPPI